MTLEEYIKQFPLTKGSYPRNDVDRIRIHAFKSAIPVKKETRSDRQNRYMWAVVYKTIGDSLGYTPEEVHQIFGEMFLSYQKDFKKFVRSTTSLKTDEMENYLEQVRRFAATELSINVPLPNEVE